MEELFAPPAYEWKRLSPKYLSMRQLTSLVVPPILFTIPAVIVGLTTGRWWISGLIWAAAIVIVLLRLGFVGRNWRSWGYVEREDDLYITHGVMFRSLIAVPYGRMQLVDINRGPLARALGLSELRFVTAAASSTVVIPGLPEAEAEELRDRLVALAESRRAGL